MKPMKVSYSRAAAALLLASAAFSVTGCGAINGLRAKNQLNEGARAYKAGHFSEAQAHFKQALDLDPSQKNAPFFIARSLHAQYKPGVEAPENVAKARAAIDAYQKVLDQDPKNDEAYNAVVYLYRSIKDENQEREWLTRRATLQTGLPEKRAQAYTVLASKQWNCSYTITEQKANQATVMKDGRAIVQYKKPKEQKDFDQAQKCAADGMSLVSQALSLDQNSEQAWSYKTNLLLEMVKLAKMEGNAEKAAEFQKQADEGQKRTLQLSEENKRKREALEKAANANKPAA